MVVINATPTEYIKVCIASGCIQNLLKFSKVKPPEPFVKA